MNSRTPPVPVRTPRRNLVFRGLGVKKREKRPFDGEVVVKSLEGGRDFEKMLFDVVDVVTSLDDVLGEYNNRFNKDDLLTGRRARETPLGMNDAMVDFVEFGSF